MARSRQLQQEKLNIVGSSTFGRYPKISVEKTYNMFMSDGWLVPYSGYLAIRDGDGSVVSLGKEGRGIFTSTILNKMIVIVDNAAYTVEVQFNIKTNKPFLFVKTFIGNLNSLKGPVYLAENNAGQIAIVDGAKIYIYQPSVSPLLSVVSFDQPQDEFFPGYITFQNTRFIATSVGTPNWRLSISNNGKLWPGPSSDVAASYTGALETKGNNTVGVVRFPGQGNMLFVMGQTVVESWFDTGYQLFPYTRNTSFNIDYGCLSPATIASMDQIVVWLAINEKSGPIIMASDGGAPEKISTDGLDYLMSQFINPSDSAAFIVRQDGHLIYHINFYTDNISFFYDFNTKLLYHACDEKLNYFIARSVAFYNDQYYFVSNNNGSIYAFDTIYTTFNGAVIPRFRTTKSTRWLDQNNREINEIGFTMEQGTTDYSYTTQEVDGSPVQAVIQPHVDLSISIDGGNSFSSDLAYDLNPIGIGRNKVNWYNLGLANDLVCQIKFWSYGRPVIGDGYVMVR
jgi:hypothetical protein